MDSCKLPTNGAETRVRRNKNRDNNCGSKEFSTPGLLTASNKHCATTKSTSLECEAALSLAQHGPKPVERREGVCFTRG